ncbi:MAG: tyrosine-type recombinase/integrase [Desulfobacula sp.]|uniref:tyrosine-type recombinase/integrase n=1 Tax=Desulfobacula sp. TaxID=2593537 RepID=UPI0025C1D80B|nr:tyrosine-type recombinase/integrase [Desulfobacula sp.]MCD4718553.1 tyrosine-type recombinase/integrase [Desulfobacula sp.]
MLEIKIEHFLDYCKVSNFATRSIQSLRVRLNEFNSFIDKVPVESIQDISYRHLKEFVTQSPSIHIKKARIWSLRQFFHFLKLNGWIKTNIASDFPYPKIEKTIPHFLTIEEYNSLLSFFYCRASDATGYRNLVMIMMLGLLGLRLSSVISLNMEDVDIETGLLQITEKGGKQRPLIMPKVLCLILNQYFGFLNKRQGPLFLSKRNKRLSPRTLHDVFQKAADSVDIDKHLHAHLFRHTAGTHLNKVSDPEITRHVLGHVRSNSTRKYTHLNPDQYAAYMQIHPYMEVSP